MLKEKIFFPTLSIIIVIIIMSVYKVKSIINLLSQNQNSIDCFIGREKQTHSNNFPNRFFHEIFHLFR